MVILEPREHSDLCAVLLNFHERVPPDWDLYVFHGASHAAHARGCTRGLRGRRVVLHRSHRAAFLDFCPEARALQFAAGEGNEHYYARLQSARPYRFYHQVLSVDAEPSPIEALPGL
jgi:hypothetical protein